MKERDRQTDPPVEVVSVGFTEPDTVRAGQTLRDDRSTHLIPLEMEREREMEMAEEEE
jgi:hypothetical protein